MQRFVKCILSVLFLNVVLSCSKVGMETGEYKDAVARVYTVWGSDKQDVSDFMDGCELKSEGSDYMDFYLPDEDYVVTYMFYKGELYASALLVEDKQSVSFAKVMKKYVYVGMTMVFNPDANHAELYADEKNNIMYALYDEECKGKSYKVLGLTPLRE